MPRLFWGFVLVVSGCTTQQATPTPDAGVVAGPLLLSAGPRLLSNQTSQPLSVRGERLTSGLVLQLGPPVSRSFPLVVVDERHGFVRLPAELVKGSEPEWLVQLSVPGAVGRSQIRIVNDTGFADLKGLVRSADDSTLFVSSAPTDTVFRIDLLSKKVTPLLVDDGPSAMAMWLDASGDEWLVVAHQFSSALALLKVKEPATRRTVPAPANAAGLVVHEGKAYVAEQARDTVVAIDLASGEQLWRTPVALNPRELAIADKMLWVGSLATGIVEMIDVSTGAVVASHEPGPGTPIVGGRTAKYSASVMNGKAPRSLAWSPRLKVGFVASIGPNIGPNVDKMEVSMNGGVGVVDPARGWKRHLGFGAGVTQALALDEARGLLYASDVGLGLIRVLDAKKLSTSDAGAAKATIQEIALRLPTDFPTVRPAADFEVNGRAGLSLHTGPRALSLSSDGRRLFVLQQFTGTISVIDVSQRGKAKWVEQFEVTDVLSQQSARRMGQILYHADLGRTAMSCDACHPDGHGEGVLFEKTTPLRIYRSPTVRGSRETPPYFTPASTRSLGETASVVGGRNRFHNPDPSPTEIDALTLFASLIPTLPNPFVGADGAPAESLELPDGRVGHPRLGLALFEGKAGCQACHPSPQFTLDQDAITRGRFIDVGTPKFMPLREAMQNTHFEGFGTPALVGAWDVFPMLTTGLAGLAVMPDGAVRVDTRFPLRVAVEKWAPSHGRADVLTEAERDDLLAYVMSL